MGIWSIFLKKIKCLVFLSSFVFLYKILKNNAIQNGVMIIDIWIAYVSIYLSSNQ
jgi:hypothetical protein